MGSATRDPLPGTRPEGAQTDEEAARHIRRMFSDIAGRYDLLNHLLSCDLDRLWRRRTAAAFDDILQLPHARALDLCCGTGDLALALGRQAMHSSSPGAEIFASDFAHPMLLRAAEKTRTRRGNSAEGARGIGYCEADALHLPFPDACFDLITIAFGFRNLANYEAGLREILRLLHPGGSVGILEFCEPQGRFFGPLYGFYFRRVLPLIGRMFSGNESAYGYLPASVERFPGPQELCGRMRAAGFTGVEFELWTRGAVALFRGKRG